VKRILPALPALVVLVAAGCGSSSSHSASTAASTASTTRAVSATAPARDVPQLAAPVNPPERSVTVPILTWHRVDYFAQELTKSIPDETVEPPVFDAEIRAIAEHHFHPISQLQLYDALFHGAPLPSNPVLLTVDDGYVDDVKRILPELQRYHFVATFYVITKRTHEPGFLNPTEIRRLDAAGMDIGAHTRHHVPLNALPVGLMKNEIIGSRDDLQRILHHPVQWFAYPFGAYDSAVVDEVHRAGFVLAVTTRGGDRESSLTPLTMPRIHVGRAATEATVLACVETPGACGGGGG
jgi:peptidoglycan/xylan/chitin deacetylase (PgdA/CDA1 family)